MLDRNQELVASLGRVSDNIAHELRTPLARLRTVLDGSSPEGTLKARMWKRPASRPTGSSRYSMRCCGLPGWIPGGTGSSAIPSSSTNWFDAVEFYAPEAEARQQSIGAPSLPAPSSATGT